VSVVFTFIGMFYHAQEQKPYAQVIQPDAQAELSTPYEAPLLKQLLQDNKKNSYSTFHDHYLRQRLIINQR
jgi:hypothetical protein